MISSKFCIDFFFRYNSKLLITPIPDIKFDEFLQLLLPYNSVSKETILLSLHNKFQEGIILCLETFFLVFEEIQQGQTPISATLEGLISQFMNFINIEYKAIYLYNQAKLFLFKEIDYQKLSYKRLLNFLQDVDQYIVKFLKRQVLLDLFHKGFSQAFEEMNFLHPVLEKDHDNLPTFQVFLKIKDFLKENLLELTEIWVHNENSTRGLLHNQEISENLFADNDETPNKYDKSSSFHASKQQRILENLRKSNDDLINSFSGHSQIEIELKYINQPEEFLIKNNQNFDNQNNRSNRFDDTVLPLKDNNMSWDDNFENIHKGNLMKCQTKSVNDKLIMKNNDSIIKQKELSSRLSYKDFNGVTTDFLNPKDNFKRYFMENTKYIVKTKEKVPSFGRLPIYTQINGVTFTDPLYLLEQTNKKDDFCLFKGFEDEDIDEGADYLDTTLFSQNIKSTSFDSKDSPRENKEKEDSIMSHGNISSPTKKGKKKISRTRPKDKKNTKKSKDELSPAHNSNEFNTFSLQMATSQINLALFRNNNTGSSSENDEVDHEHNIEASPLIRRHNFLKTTFIDENFMHKNKNLSFYFGNFLEENQEIEVLVQEPEILKAISLSCGVSNNKSSVLFYSKWHLNKEIRLKNTKVLKNAQRKWVILKKTFGNYLLAKKKFRMVHSFKEFLKDKVFKDDNFLVNKAMRFDDVLLGKGMKQGQGDGLCEKEGDFMYVKNRKLQNFKKIELQIKYDEGNCY